MTNSLRFVKFITETSIKVSRIALSLDCMTFDIWIYEYIIVPPKYQNEIE